MNAERKRATVSDAAVLKASGKNWNQWIRFLDEEGAGELTHPDIVKLLATKKLVPSPWWRQEITVHYEKAKGRRQPGQNADGAFQVGVSRTLSVPVAAAWKLVTSTEGLSAWLGGKPRRLAIGASPTCFRWRTGLGISWSACDGPGTGA